MHSKPRILAVDDDPINLAVIEESLGYRYELRLASDGAEALRVGPTFCPDIVLLDIMMPGVDGYVICHALKNEPTLRNTRIIMVSAKANADERQRGYQAGADDYITKPFTEDELLVKIRVALRTKAADELESIEKELRKLCGMTADALAVISHMRDAETGEHLVRMRSYAHILAGELRTRPTGREMNDEFLDDLYYASVLHDIGKVGIPDSILRKPGPLSTAEFEQMKLHTIIGEEILSRWGVQNRAYGSFFRMAAKVARSHHENFDGSGYPDGLRGEQIPLAARVVRLADTFDAITSTRVYKPARGPEDALEEINNGEGTVFDPNVVEAFHAVYDEFVDFLQCSDQKDAFELHAIT